MHHAPMSLRTGALSGQFRAHIQLLLSDMGKDLWGRQRGSRSGPSQGAADDKMAQMRGASQESSAVSELEGYWEAEEGGRVGGV